MMKKLPPLTWTEVDLTAIEHNLKEIRKCAGRNKFFIPTRPESFRRKLIATHLLAVVKSDAYGHGVRAVSGLLRKKDVQFFGVSNVFEGVELRGLGIKGPILILETTLHEYVSTIVEYELTPTVGDLDFAALLNAAAKKKKRRVDIHVKVDTGMGRLGVSLKAAFDFICALYDFTHLRIMGIYTHFPVADTDVGFTKKQIQDLYALVLRLDQKGMVIPFIHAANSMGLAGYKTRVLNVARPGLMLYGLYPSEKLKRSLKLKPALSVYSRVIYLKSVEKGQGISYGRSFIAPRAMRTAVIPIGYNDGYLRALSNKAFVLIRGKKCRVLGRVTMNQIMVDVTRLKGVKLGEKVTILGVDGKSRVTADDLARAAGTINYEIVCSLGNRLTRL